TAAARPTAHERDDILRTVLSILTSRQGLVSPTGRKLSHALRPPRGWGTFVADVRRPGARGGDGSGGDLRRSRGRPQDRDGDHRDRRGAGRGGLVRRAGRVPELRAAGAPPAADGVLPAADLDPAAGRRRRAWLSPGDRSAQGVD